MPWTALWDELVLLFATVVGLTSSNSLVRVLTSACCGFIFMHGDCSDLLEPPASLLVWLTSSGDLDDPLLVTVYQFKWSGYRRWCRDKGHSSSSPSIPKIAKFLLWLWRSRGLSLAAVQAYRSMLSAVFSLKLPGISSYHVLMYLLRSIAVEYPRGLVAIPSWDLDVVLRQLSSSACEPLESEFVRTLIKEMLFLVSLATAKRVSKL